MGKQAEFLESDTDAHDERVSALFDGELDDAEAHRLLVGGGAATGGRQWTEYALIGDAMRGCAAADGGFMGRLHDTLAAEPTVLAPLPVRPPATRKVLWTAAAAATAAGIAWGVLRAVPEPEPALPLAAAQQVAGVPADTEHDVRAYLAAHQDYAYAVVSEPEMRFTKVSLGEAGR